MNQITTFQNPEFGEIRITHDADSDPLFCVTDLCKALGYNNSRDALRKHVEQGDVAKCDTPTTSGIQRMSYVNESGLYSLILSSKLPNARKFKHWVTSEVLPQIRKTGGYIPVTQEDDEKTILAKAVQILMKTVDMQKAELAEQDIEIARLAPKAQYAEEVLQSPSCYTMTEVAKSLSMTVQELQRRLHTMGIIFRSVSGTWMLYADYQKKGYEAYRTRCGRNLFGDPTWTNSYLVWTEKGKKFIHETMGECLCVK